VEEKEQQIKELTDLVEKLTNRIEELENKLAKYDVPKNSSNSSIPPSKDENRPNKTRSLRGKSGKKSGGQPGHKGHRLEMSTTPDQIITHIPDFCNRCGKSLSKVHANHQLSRQIVDIPIPKAFYTEHQSYAKTCCCGHTTCAQMPEHIKAPIQYGSNIEALVGYLHARQYVPYQRLSEILSTCFGIPLSEGSIDNLISRLAHKAKPIYERIHDEIAMAQVVGSDETGVKINGKKNWIWTWQNQDYTFITVSPSRGYQVIEEEYPEGFPNAVLCHDAWRAHLKCIAEGHQLCLAHLLRELHYLEERYPLHHWASKCKQVFAESIELKGTLQPKDFLQPISQRSEIEERLDRLLEENIPTENKEVITFRNRLIKYRKHLFVFLYHYNIPADNNGSERAIRNVKVKQKISGQFRSFEGAKKFVTLRSLIDSSIKQSLNVIDQLRLIAQMNPS